MAHRTEYHRIAEIVRPHLTAMLAECEREIGISAYNTLLWAIVAMIQGSTWKEEVEEEEATA